MTQKLLLPKSYKSPLDVAATEFAIKYIKDYFQVHLSRALNLRRVSAPVVVPVKTGINDYLNGTERPVRFHVKNMNEEAEVVQSLAKWKRVALADYGFKRGEGLYTDMNAIRPDEVLDNLHSVYVDQWDWERVIGGGDRTIEFLKAAVEKIYAVVRNTQRAVCKKYKNLGKPFLPAKIFFIHSEEIEARYPDLSPSEREDAVCKEKGAVFVIGIGAKLKNGLPHDGRASDYDDWSTPTRGGRRGLNGDILVWYPVLNRSYELSSMGIRVDAKALKLQIEIRGEGDKLSLDYHKRIIGGKLPLTIGGGIGQSRLCMFYLKKAHIGEVQASIWPDEMIRECKRAGVNLL